MRLMTAFTILLLLASPVCADELDGLLEGFSAEPDVVAEDAAADHKLPDWLRLGGSVGLWASYAYAHDTQYAFKTEHRGLAMLKPDISLEADFDLPGSLEARLTAGGFWDSAYRIRGHSAYPQAVVDEYEYEAEVREAWLGGSFGRLDVRCGRQVEVWGFSDNIRITDVVNPLDNRNPGLVDIEDLRLPLLMSRAEYYWGNWSLGGLLVHEIGFMRNPVYGSDFFPGMSPLPYADDPASTWENTEYALTLKGIFEGYDVAFYAGRFFDDNAHVEQALPGVNVQCHSRLTMAGGAFNYAWGNWLFKAEAAWFTGLEYYILPTSEFSRTDVLLGIEYSGFGDTSISLEVADRHLNHYDWRLNYTPEGVMEDDFITALRLSRDFKNDTLHLNVLALIYGSRGQGGALKRIDLSYDIMDALVITGGIVDYTSGDNLIFRHAGDNDRLFVNIKYSF